MYIDGSNYERTTCDVKRKEGRGTGRPSRQLISQHPTSHHRYRTFYLRSLGHTIVNAAHRFTPSNSESCSSKHHPQSSASYFSRYTIYSLAQPCSVLDLNSKMLSASCVDTIDRPSMSCWKSGAVRWRHPSRSPVVVYFIGSFDIDLMLKIFFVVGVSLATSSRTFP